MNRFKFFLLSTLFFGFAFSSCNKNDDEPMELPSVRLSDTVLELHVGDNGYLTAYFSFEGPNYDSCSWVPDDYSVVRIFKPFNDRQITVRALSVGETTVKVVVYMHDTDYKPTATFRVIVKPDEPVKLKTYTVSFDLKGGSGNFPSQLVEEGQCAVKPETIPTKEGYTFLGWDYEGNDYWYVDFSRPITENITVFARWKEEVKYDYVDLGVNVNGEKILWANTDAYRFYEKYFGYFTEEELNSLPTQEELDALSEQCYWVWHQESPQGMYIFKAHEGHTSQNHYCASSFGEYNTETDPYIFLPSDGHNRCYYWTGTPYDNDNHQYSLACTPRDWYYNGYNSIGYPWCVRFVKRSK